MPQKSVAVMKEVDEFSGDSAELKRLRSTHTLYELYVQQWDLYLGAYEGGPDFANEKNIFRHFRENEDDFRDRTRRIHYLNYCEQLVDFFTNFIYSEVIDRDGGTNSDFFGDFIKDVSRKGDSLDDYMRRVCEETRVFGMCYTLVDAPRRDPSQVLTKQQEIENGVRPYWVFMRPDEVMDWAVDDFENFLYLKRREIKSAMVSGSASPRVLEVYQEWYTDRIVVTEVDITDPTHPSVSSAVTMPNAMNKIPILVHRYKRSRRYPFIGNSFLRDFAYNNREIMNLTSLLQEFLYRQCFNLLVKEVESSVPITSQQDGIFGTSNVMEYPKGAKAPQYLTPPADPARFIQDERQLIKQEMYTRAAQDAMRELFNGEKSSGFSQAQSFSKTVPFIAAQADSLESDEKTLMSLTMERIGKKWDGSIKYKDHYEITNLTDAMTQLITLLRDLQLPSETFAKEELTRLVRQYDGKLPADTLQKVYKEIEGMDFDQWLETQKEALVGASKSPGEQQKPKSTGTMQEIQAEARLPNTKATKKLKS